MTDAAQVHEKQIPTRTARNVIRTTLVMVALAVVLLAAVPLCLVQVERAVGAGRGRPVWLPCPMLGMVCFGAGCLLGVVSGYALAVAGDGTPLPLDCPRRLVVSGPYRHTRNPFALGGLLMGLGVGLFLGSPLTLAYVVLGALLWNFRARPWEEADLERRFGDEFRRYRCSVPCWRVRFRPYAPDENPSARP